eukprot:Em0830g3a
MTYGIVSACIVIRTRQCHAHQSPTIIWVPGDLPATAPADPEGEGVHLCGAIYLLSTNSSCQQNTVRCADATHEMSSSVLLPLLHYSALTPDYKTELLSAESHDSGRGSVMGGVCSRLFPWERMWCKSSLDRGAVKELQSKLELTSFVLTHCPEEELRHVLKERGAMEVQVGGRRMWSEGEERVWSGEWYRGVSGGCGRGVVKGVVMWSELEKGVIRGVMEGVARGGKVGEGVVRVVVRSESRIMEEWIYLTLSRALPAGIGKMKHLFEALGLLWGITNGGESMDYKAVLVMACELKQGPLDQNKDVVLMRPLRDMNFPKFVFEVFLGLIGDFFPGLDCPRVHYPKFNDAMEGVPSDGKHIQLPHRVGKIVQTMLKWLHLHDGGLNWKGLGCGIVCHCAGWCLWIQRSWDTSEWANVLS